MERSVQIQELMRRALGAERSAAFTIMIHPCDNFVSERCTRTGAVLAATLDGEVLGLGCWPEEEYENVLDRLNETAARRFAEILAETGARGRWRAAAMSPMRFVGALAHEADLIVTAPRDSAAERATDHVKHLLGNTGRPVYVCYGLPRAGADHAVICWNDSPQIRRASADALPLLRQARSALLLAVCSSEDVNQTVRRLHEVAAGFRARGVHTKTLVRAFRGQRLAEVVREVAVEMDADFVVAGAYGQGMIRRTLSGSNTDDLLRTLNHPLLLSH